MDSTAIRVKKSLESIDQDIQLILRFEDLTPFGYEKIAWRRTPQQKKTNDNGLQVNEPIISYLFDISIARKSNKILILND
mgnify:CR=1 FL=1